MNFFHWLNLQEKTLYHGTVIDYEDSIRKYGLHGGWNEPDKTWVGHAYDEYEDDRTEEDDVVFMSDKKSLDKSVGAMTFHVGQKLGKDFHDVTDNDIRNHGLLVIIKDDDTEQYNPDDSRWNHEYLPRGVEPGDYFTPSTKGDLFLKGSALLRYLTKYGVWPRNWGASDKAAKEKHDRDQLARMAISKVKDKTKSDILNIVKTAPYDQIKQQLKSW